MIEEKHYTVKELAEKLGVSYWTVRRMFIDTPGVLKLGARGRRKKRDHLTLRIPASVADRFYREGCR